MKPEVREKEKTKALASACTHDLTPEVREKERTKALAGACTQGKLPPSQQEEGRARTSVARKWGKGRSEACAEASKAVQ